MSDQATQTTLFTPQKNDRATQTEPSACSCHSLSKFLKASGASSRAPARRSKATPKPKTTTTTTTTTKATSPTSHRSDESSPPSPNLAPSDPAAPFSETSSNTLGKATGKKATKDADARNRYAHWTPQEFTYMQTERSKFPPTSWAMIASFLHRQPSACERKHQQHIDMAGLPEDFSWTKDMDTRLVDERKTGKTIKEVASELNLPVTAVSRRSATLRKRDEIPVEVLQRPKSRAGKSKRKRDDGVGVLSESSGNAKVLSTDAGGIGGDGEDAEGVNVADKENQESGVVKKAKG